MSTERQVSDTQIMSGVFVETTISPVSVHDMHARMQAGSPCTLQHVSNWLNALMQHASSGSLLCSMHQAGSVILCSMHHISQFDTNGRVLSYYNTQFIVQTIHDLLPLFTSTFYCSLDNPEPKCLADLVETLSRQLPCQEWHIVNATSKPSPFPKQCAIIILTHTSCWYSRHSVFFYSVRCKGLDDSTLARLQRVRMTETLCARGRCDEDSRYLSVCVGFLNTDVEMVPSEWCVRSTSLQHTDEEAHVISVHA